MTAKEILEARNEVVTRFDYEKFNEVVDFFFLDVDDTRRPLRICVLEPSDYTPLIKEQGFVEDIDNRYERIFRYKDVKGEVEKYHREHPEFRNRPIEDAITELFGKGAADVACLHREDKESEFSCNNEYDIAVAKQYISQVLETLKNQGFRVEKGKPYSTYRRHYTFYYIFLV